MASTTTNGALLKSHEGRIQRVEDVTSELLAGVAKQGATLEAIGDTVRGIDTKLDEHRDLLSTHKTEDADVALRVHDLEVKQKDKDKFNKNVNYAFYTALAGIAVDLALRFVEHGSKVASAVADMAK
jgi:hypothetical protein